ncbi:HAMP domain-containing protein [Aggregicoccus sp. 17bor-14]|uniref:sensor histidine kinase n=1 Tax=Myxococcaceae TaxID=31 RepID=UPI00129D15F9|nr:MULTISPECIES: ATP-binding protein [Myxococcaceae]MBF5045139.1 HAMP domain-containing protein [Simulacricoccus sp. 17bor-14]MRI90881.1 HAMP domain-containing protein [Aggregicoccus sp. 17bor-14]
MHRPTPLRLEWFAAAFGLLMGLTMVYVPYAFTASAFRAVYPHVRPLGACFLVGATAVIVTLLYPGRRAWVAAGARALLLAPLAAYWWWVAVGGGGRTGILIYPLMAAGLVVEALPGWRRRSLLRPFLCAVAAAFGANMALRPGDYGATMYGGLRAVMQPLGLCFLAVALLLGASQLRPALPARRAGALALGLLGVLFAVLATALGRGGAWTGMELYALLSLTCALELLGPGWLPRPSGVRWRLLRGITLAAVLPLLALGGLAIGVSQRAIERELHAQARLAASAEAAWLDQGVRGARALLAAEAASPQLVREVLARDTAALQRRLARLEANGGMVDVFTVMDAEGHFVGASPRVGSVSGNFADRDYFRQAVRPDSVFISEPLMAAVGHPFVVLSVPVFHEGRRVAVLTGGLALERLAHASSLASGRYRVQVLDVRDGRVLRDTGSGALLALPRLPAPLRAAEGGSSEAFGEGERLLLQASARAAEAPWVAVTTTELQSAYAPITRLGLSVVLIALGVGALAVVLAHWVGRDMASRVEALRDAVAAFERGPLEQHPLPPRGDDELAQLTEGFNQMVARIAHSQAELRDAVAVREQFLSVASHELRTPLTPLRMGLELLLRQAEAAQGAEPERARTLLQRSLRQVDRLTRLVGDMLDVTRLQAGRFTLQPREVDLAALAHEAVERVRLSPAGASAQLSLELPAGPLVGRWDEQRLEQVLTNLLENGLRYSPAPARLGVRLRAEGDSALLEVQDEGIGVPPESLGRLFTPFFRADNAARHHAGGVGLGLAICREIVERHGGRIEAHSAGVGQGTLFRVRLPTGLAAGEQLRAG